MSNSTTGLNKETAAALSYVLGPLSGLVFLILEKDAFVRFHALQSIVTLGIIGFSAVLFTFIPFAGIFWVLYFVAILIGAYNASQGKKFEFPIIGKFATKLLNK